MTRRSAPSTMTRWARTLTKKRRRRSGRIGTRAATPIMTRSRRCAARGRATPRRFCTLRGRRRARCSPLRTISCSLLRTSILRLPCSAKQRTARAARRSCLSLALMIRSWRRARATTSGATSTARPRREEHSWRAPFGSRRACRTTKKRLQRSRSSTLPRPSLRRWARKRRTAPSPSGSTRIPAAFCVTPRAASKQSLRR